MPRHRRSAFPFIFQAFTTNETEEVKLEFRRKVEKEMRFHLVVHDPDHCSIIDLQPRDHAVIEANDASRWQTATRRDGRSVAVAEAKRQGNTDDKPDRNQSAKTAGGKTIGTVGKRTSVLFVVSKVTSNGLPPNP